MVIVEDITVLYIPALLRTIKLNGSYYLSVLIYSCIILSIRMMLDERESISRHKKLFHANIL